MSANSPASILFTISGVPLGVDDGQSATTSGLQGLVVAGSDGTELHHIRTTADGSIRIDPIGTTAQPVTDNGGSLTIDATSLPLPIGAATETTLSTLLTENVFLDHIGEVQSTPTVNTILGRLKDLYDILIARLGTLGQKLMSGSTPVVIASDQTPIQTSLTDSDGTPVGVDDGESIPVGTDGILAMGSDYTGYARRIRTTADGRLIVNSAVAAPPATSVVNQGVTGDVATVTDVFYTIPNGEQLKIQRFAGGGEQATGGSKVELYWAPNGNTTGIERIRVGYVNGNNFEFTLDWDAPALGNGTRAILIRRERFSGGAIELAGFWDGYY
jgi:hypothetical protein